MPPKERPTMPNLYTTQEICARFDVSKSTLFRWEKEGRLHAVRRDWRNWRLYSARNVKEIFQIINAPKLKHDTGQKHKPARPMSVGDKRASHGAT